MTEVEALNGQMVVFRDNDGKQQVGLVMTTEALGLPGHLGISTEHTFGTYPRLPADVRLAEPREIEQAARHQGYLEAEA